MKLPDALVLTVAALLGAAVGSFLNVCIYRIPREGMSVGSPRRSHCPACGFAIPWHDNLPILSWLWLGGRCRSCRAPISLRYLVVEALTAMAFAVLAHRYLMAGEPEWGLGLAVAALAAASIAAGFVDQDLQIIPDEITLPGMMAVPLLALLVPDFHLPASDGLSGLLARLEAPLSRFAQALPAGLGDPLPLAGVVAAAALAASALGVRGYLLYWRIAHPGDPKRLRDGALAGVLSAAVAGGLTAMALRPDWTLHPRIHSLWAALAGMAAGAGLIFFVGAVARQVFRKEAMGFGDVKLMGLLGGFAGWKGVVAGFGLASFLGSAVGIYRLVRYRDRYLPFGPYLALGCLAVIIWPHALWEAVVWYMGLFGG